MRLRITACNPILNLTIPDIYKKFNQNQMAEGIQNSAISDILRLNIESQSLPDRFRPHKMLCQVELWQMWQDSQENTVIYLPWKSPQRWIVVDHEFHEGVLYMDISTVDDDQFFPIPVVDIVLYSNWFAKYNDLILHAAGIAVDGKGYGFIGHSGQGKSTLVRDLAHQAGLTVLGEDQIVMRYLDGKFWIFGTPWHEDPDICSPIGVPLEKLFFLDWKQAQTITYFSPFEGVTSLMQTAFVPYYRPDSVNTILERLGILAGQIPFFKLSYQRGTDILPHILAA